MFTLFYTFLLIYTCLLFLHAEKSNKRWNSNVFAYTFTLVPLSRGKCSGVNVYASATMAMLPGRTIR